MKGSLVRGATTDDARLLHTVKPLRRTIFNRVFAAIYAPAILTLLYYHAKTLIFSATLVSFSATLALLFSDLVLAFMWVTTQTFRICPVNRKQFPENVEKILKRSDFPALDVFVCTADPYKEPPIGVVNTALAVMAYDYPAEKISVYISDDGGSALTLFAFMEAAKFATHWLPFCKKNNILERSPESYFGSNHPCTSESEKIKMMYESMKVKVEHVLERGTVGDQYITSDQEREAFNKWSSNFTRQDHPAVIQVLLDASKDKDVDGYLMPNLIYISREKNKSSPHHFKAGALNALIRVSGSMTNAPIVLALDCDFRSNDPRTPLRVLCYLCDPATPPNLAFVQFPQLFQGINTSDIYNAEYKRLFQINMLGFDGLSGPNYVGTGCFFRRRSFFGCPTSLISPEIPELAPDYVVDKPIQSQSILSLAHRIGLRYGSLVEDYYTGFRLHCEGWKSVFCNPERPAFFGDVPTGLIDALNQQKRWAVGLLEVAFSKYSPATYGCWRMGPLMGLGYAHIAFWPIWSVPITTYAFLPQLALLNKVSEPWFFLYAFLFLGAYGQDYLDFILAGGSVQRWWSDQRFWIARGLTSHFFGSMEFFLGCLGISASGFTVTSKAVDAEQSKRYDQGIFEFGVHSPMFVSLTSAAIINLIAFSQGLVEVFRGNNLEGLFVQMFISGFAVVNSLPVYEAIALRNDSGKMPIKTTITATLLAGAVYAASSFIFIGATTDDARLLHTVKPLRRTIFNRVFAAIYAPAILTLLYYHAKTLIFSATLVSFSATLALLFSDLVLAFMWVTTQTFRICPVYRKQFPENVEKILKRSDFPALDVFVCTADPYKEPPIGVVNTALAVMAYDYPAEKISVYVSDDGGSALTLFAFMEAAKFATHWLPFCKKNNILERSPEAYFGSNHPCTSESEKIKIGLRYGSLVEDYYTGFRMHCEGWKSVFCNPERPAFFGDVPTGLIDALNQQKRWAVGLLEVAFSKYSPATYGVRRMGPLMGLGYAQVAFWPIWSIPITTYAFLPQLALLNKVYIFPKVSEPWFFLYAFLFLGAYGQDYLDFILAGGSVQRWWSDQRFWIARGLTSYFFGSMEFFLGVLGISASGFTVTSKAVDAEQSKRYDQGIFEFGVHSPMFVSLTSAAIINLIAFSQGLVEVFRGNNLEGLFVQMFISGFAVVNSLPVYEAIALRNDSGKMPIKTTITATLLAGAVYAASSFIFISVTWVHAVTILLYLPIYRSIPSLDTRNHTEDIAPTKSMGARPEGGSAIQVTSIGGHPPLHTVKPLARTLFNRVFAAIYALSILALLFYHAKTLFYPTTLVSFSVTLALLISDLVLTFFWVSTQTFRMFPVCRKQFPENLTKIMERSDFPALDVFICTADPYKEPPIGVVNTALSVMAYDYPTEKISVYVSDDGGSALTLFAFMEAAKFATHWLPFCKKNNVLERSPEAYFELNHTCTSEAVNIKKIYESMKVKVEHVLERGKVDDEYISSDQDREAFNKWTRNFTRQDHPAVIQVLLDASKDKDIAGYLMPNLIYVSREKSKASPHHFKAGSMTNAPIILTLDCDSLSNDPETPLRAMCYLCDPATRPQLAYVQFPQIFRGINRSDIYNAEFKRLYQINVMGFDGLSGPNYLGTGCFFQRRAFYGSPSSLASPEIPELSPDYVVDKPVQSQSFLALAHQVASCNYESRSKQWGSKIRIIVGGLPHGFQDAMRGWKSIFCDPDRPAFLGDVPITLNDALNQQKRWSIGLLEVGFSKYSPATFGVKALGLSMGLAYAQSAFWATWSIPITAYAFLPQLALLNKVYIFPKVSEPWFFLYAFLFLGAYGQDFLDFILAGGSVQRWWSDQRFWIIRGLSSYVFGSAEFFLKFLGISAFGFNVTSKVVDDEQSRRYEQRIFEFGADSPMFVTLTVAAIINLSSLVLGLAEVFRGNSLDGLFVQMFISGFAVVNSWPIYEAIALRKDKGKMPLKTSIIATLLAGKNISDDDFRDLSMDVIIYCSIPPSNFLFFFILKEGSFHVASEYFITSEGYQKKNRKERKRHEEEAEKNIDRRNYYDKIIALEMITTTIKYGGSFKLKNLARQKPLLAVVLLLINPRLVTPRRCPYFNVDQYTDFSHVSSLSEAVP
uniref:Cellulose synthase (UDP-forming) n=1 Tax=Salix viminalis TaxID=40686 RepID=A0A6N2JX91_SALVM